jgi:hypothetical protein
MVLAERVHLQAVLVVLVAGVLQLLVLGLEVLEIRQAHLHHKEIMAGLVTGYQELLAAVAAVEGQEQQAETCKHLLLTMLVAVVLERLHLLQVHPLLTLVAVVVQPMQAEELLALVALVVAEMEEQHHLLVPLVQLIQAEGVVLQVTALTQAAQEAPALLSSSTPYHHKPYLRSKALPLGNARQV